MAFSFIQKCVAGFNPFLLNGYIVPFLFGGLSGTFIGVFFFRRKQAIDELRRYKANLEELVVERTKNLRKANKELEVEIAEREKVEKAFQEREALLNHSQEIASMGSFIWDLRNDALFWSRNMYAIHGLDETRFSGKLTEVSRELIHPDDRDRVQEEIGRMIRAGRVWSMEFRVGRPDGEERIMRSSGEFEFNEGGEPVRCFGVHQDITQHKRAEEELRESEQKYRTLFERNLNPIAVIDTDGRYLDANEAFLNFVEKPREDLLTMGVFDFSSPEKRGIQEKTHVPLWKNGGTIETGYWIHGRAKTLELTITPCSYQGIDAVVGVGKDVTEEKIVEKALAENEFRFRSFVENANDIVYSISAQGLFTYVSPNWADFMGEPPEEAIGKSFEPYVHPEDVPLCREFLERVLSTGRKQSSVEYRVRHCNGFWRWHVSNGSPLRDAEGNVTGYLGIARDITEQKERELEYAQILQTAIDGFWLLDADGRLLEVNASAAAQLGYTPEEMTGLTITDIEANETPEETRQHIQRLQEEGSTLFETQHRRKDGSLIDVEVSASYTPIGGGRFVVFTRNITERKRAEREDLLNKARLEIVHQIASMPEAAEKDICDFVLESILEFTGSAIGFLGFMSEDEQSMHIHAWSSSAMEACAIHEKPIEFPMAKAGLWGEPIRNREPIIVNDYNASHPAKNGCPKGHVAICRFMAVPVFEGDRIVAIGAVGNRQRPYEEADVRQLMLLMDSWWEQVRRRQAIREKEALQARLQQAQKMESIGTLAGGIAHDFNNILSIILGNTEMAMHDLHAWSPAQQSLKEAREASLRARDLVNQLLLFARQKEQTVSSLRVEPIAKESLKMLRASIPTTVEIQEDIQEGLPPVLGDPSQVQQIIVNLCTNAAQTMEEEGGRMDVKLDSVQVKGALNTSSGPIPEGQFVRMQVRDTGPGISPADLERIFEPFFTTKGVGEGTGLGLAVVHGIVRDRQGGILVESEEGKGTVFTVYLPASEEEPAQSSLDEDSELPEGQERILFVDDEPMIMKLGRRILERQGYEVETRASGTDALECFRQDPNRFDLVVTDMTMPGLRGDKLAEEMLKIRPHLPVILSTGFSKQISEEKAKELGIRAFVMKPLTGHQLADTVRQVLDKK